MKKSSGYGLPCFSKSFDVVLYFLLLDQLQLLGFDSIVISYVVKHVLYIECCGCCFTYGCRFFNVLQNTDKQTWNRGQSVLKRELLNERILLEELLVDPGNRSREGALPREEGRKLPQSWPMTGHSNRRSFFLVSLCLYQHMFIMWEELIRILGIYSKFIFKGRSTDWDKIRKKEVNFVWFPLPF